MNNLNKYLFAFFIMFLGSVNYTSAQNTDNSWFISNVWGTSTSAANYTQSGNVTSAPSNTTSAANYTQSGNVTSVLGSNSILNGSSMNANIVIPNTTNSLSSNSQATNMSLVNQNSSYLNIPINVQNLIGFLQNKYSLSQSQILSLNQIARSYQYVIVNNPNTKQSAYNSNIRDVAATNCAETRLPANILDDVVTQIEAASLDTQSKKTAYNNYISLLDEGTPNQNTASYCEDEYSNTNQTNTINISDTNLQPQNLNINSSGSRDVYAGIISDTEVRSSCLILTHFMEFGSKSPQVLQLQNFLMENGYMEMYPTGFYGRNTEAAIREWQKRHVIDIRGYVGPSTRGSIANTTCKNQDAVNRAVKGAVYKPYTAPKKVATKKVATSDKGGYAQSGIKNNTNTKITISTTTEIVSYVATSTTSFSSGNTSQTTSLSSVSGTFFLKRNPINTLYFSYKANTSRDDVFMCIEKNNISKCSDSTNFSIVKQIYEPGNMDIINNGDRWIYNIYYSSNNFGDQGAKIYFRNGISSVSEVYTIKTSISL